MTPAVTIGNEAAIESAEHGERSNACPASTDLWP